MCLFEIVHDVQLAHVSKVPVHGFHQAVDELEDRKFVLHHPTTSREIIDSLRQLLSLGSSVSFFSSSLFGRWFYTFTHAPRLGPRRP